ncbi:MAG TPA: hypothetical protein PLF30_01315 [Candidatus Moranbacteria bacterium]|nr:hypothetical protein [Candidatus Moranbacteria bacterium]HQB59235.1 hypothetical protein [Candidatus Moranbacteria bacterium]
MESKKIKTVSFLVIVVLAGVFCVAKNSYAATVYVDQTLAENCDGTTTHYDPAVRTCLVGEGVKATSSLKDMLWGSATGCEMAIGDQIAQPGDTIYLRGGTYREGYWNSNSTSIGGCSGNGSQMAISYRISGTSWNEGEYTTIASYPGEWAIIDGQGNRFAFGWGTLSGGYLRENPENWLKYIVFERLEITGGGDSGGAGGGLGWSGGPNKVRYCYIHDNAYPALSTTNAAGILIYGGMGSVFEYNYFERNGGIGQAANRNHIEIFADYLYKTPMEEGSPRYAFDGCNRDNEIRYNFFGPGAHTAYHDKAAQYLTTFNSLGAVALNSDLTRKEHGNKLHHNIVLGGEGMETSFYATQDFEQIHNNIVDCKIGIPSTDYPTFWRSIYNNTVIGDGIVNDMGGGLGYTEADLNTFIVNNISTSFTPLDYYPAFGVAILWFQNDPCNHEYTWTNTLVDRNFVHNPGSSSRHFGLPNSYLCKSTRWITTSAFNTLRGVNNYTNSNLGLFQSSSGADQYKTAGSFLLDGTRTISDGGLGGNHPYLDSVTIPSYVGATNPNDNDWVDGVLSLANVSTLQNAPSGDPAWIEGASQSGDETAPASPSGLNVS